LAAEVGCSGVVLYKAGEDFQQRRFTGSIRAEQNNELAGGDIKGNIAEYGHGRVAETEVMQVKDGHKNWFYISNTLQYRIESAI